jgi:hypothetical protein
MLGRPFPPEADQHHNPYLAYSSILLAPWIALPARTGIAVWMGVQLAALMWTPLIWLAMLRWRLSPFAVAARFRPDLRLSLPHRHVRAGAVHRRFCCRSRWDSGCWFRVAMRWRDWY